MKRLGLIQGFLLTTVGLMVSLHPGHAQGAEGGGANVPNPGGATAQLPPADVSMSEEACAVLIQQAEPQWQAYDQWAKYRADRKAHWNRDGIARTVINIKNFSAGLTSDERILIGNYLSGKSQTAISITQLLSKANDRISHLMAIRDGKSSNEDSDVNSAEPYRVSFKVTDNPPNIQIGSAGRIRRFDFTYADSAELEKKVKPIRIFFNNNAEAEQAAADAAGNEMLQKVIDASSPDDPHYANKQEFMVGRKATPLVCFVRPKPPAPPAKAVADQSSNSRQDREWRMWDGFDRMDRMERRDRGTWSSGAGKR